jgi:hypothetical protein
MMSTEEIEERAIPFSSPGRRREGLNIRRRGSGKLEVPL